MLPRRQLPQAEIGSQASTRQSAVRAAGRPDALLRETRNSSTSTPPLALAHRGASLAARGLFFQRCAATRCLSALHSARAGRLRLDRCSKQSCFVCPMDRLSQWCRQRGDSCRSEVARVRKAVRYCSLRDAMAAYRPLLPVAGQASAGEFRLVADIAPSSLECHYAVLTEKAVCQQMEVKRCKSETS
jgi:hypothetical protein